MRLIVKEMPENVKDCKYYDTKSIYDEREDAWIGTKEYCLKAGESNGMPCNKNPKLCPYFCDLKDEKEDDNFKVGDEIIFKKNGLYHEGKTGIIYKVLHDSEDNIYYLIRFPDGTFINHDGSNIKKTGKTYPYSPY
jgi:hypothetical protein